MAPRTRQSGRGFSAADIAKATRLSEETADVDRFFCSSAASAVAASHFICSSTTRASARSELPRATTCISAMFAFSWAFSASSAAFRFASSSARARKNAISSALSSRTLCMRCAVIINPAWSSAIDDMHFSPHRVQATQSSHPSLLNARAPA